jgi:hypothetical protein
VTPPHGRAKSPLLNAKAAARVSTSARAETNLGRHHRAKGTT